MCGIFPDAFSKQIIDHILFLKILVKGQFLANVIGYVCLEG